MDDLVTILTTIRTRIAEYASRGIGEQNTKATLIVPVLRTLGWDPEDLEEVRLEYRRRPSDKPVDYALFINRIPRLFIEAKALGENLEDQRWANQIVSYATVAGVKWVVLTNGDQYRIYNSHAEVPVEQKLFRKVSVIDADSRPEETIGLLSKESIAEIEELWREDFIDRRVRDAITGLFSPDPDASLVRLVRRRVPDLSPSQAKAALGRLKFRLDAGESIAPTGDGVEAPRPKQGREGRVTKKEPHGEGTPWSAVTMKDVLAAGLVTPPLDLERPYKGAVLKAQLEADGRITFNGQAYDSLSTAAGMARRSIVGAKPGRKYPQTNGWTFWRFRDAGGQWEQLDELRQRLFRNPKR